MFEIYPVLITIALFVLGTSITIRHFKIIRTVSYIERFNNPSMVTIRADVEAWLGKDNSIDQKLEELEDDNELFSKVTIIYNLLTEFAIAYNYGLVSTKISHQIWFPLLPKYWRRLRFYINHSRRTGSHIGYSLEKVALRIEDYNRRKGFLVNDKLTLRLDKEANNTLHSNGESAAATSP